MVKDLFESSYKKFPTCEGHYDVHRNPPAGSYSKPVHFSHLLLLSSSLSGFNGILSSTPWPLRASSSEFFPVKI